MVALVVGGFRCYTHTGKWWEIFSVLKCLWWWETLGAIIIIMIYYGHIMALVVRDSQCYHIYGSGGGRLSVLSYIWLWWWETLRAIIYMALVVRDSQCYDIYGSGGGRLSVL